MPPQNPEGFQLLVNCRHLERFPIYAYIRSMKHFAIAAFALVLCGASNSVNADENSAIAPDGYDSRIIQLPVSLALLKVEYPDEIYVPGESYILPIIDNPGGDVNTFITNRLLMEHYGVGVQILGKCYSSCVIYSGMKDACVEDDTWFLFHQSNEPWGTEEVLRQMNPHFKKYIEEYAVALPPDEWATKKEKSGQAYIPLSGREAIEKGWMVKCAEY